MPSLAFVVVAVVPLVLARGADFRSPLFWAAFIGWILSVVLHEFAHGVVAYWGGDYTIRERGGTSLNPLQYLHPVNSLVMPALFLLMGGVPLPGGVNYVRTDLLRSRAWASAVSLAGPAMNLLIFLALAVAVHPKVGWVDPAAAAQDWLPAQRVAATIAVLNLFATILNLIPLPPLDGFGAISPFLDPRTQYKLLTPPASVISLMVLFVLLTSPAVFHKVHVVAEHGFRVIGFESPAYQEVSAAFDQTMFGAS